MSSARNHCVTSPGAITIAELILKCISTGLQNLIGTVQLVFVLVAVDTALLSLRVTREHICFNETVHIAAGVISTATEMNAFPNRPLVKDGLNFLCVPSGLLVKGIDIGLNARMLTNTVFLVFVWLQLVLVASILWVEQGVMLHRNLGGIKIRDQPINSMMAYGSVKTSTGQMILRTNRKRSSPVVCLELTWKG